MRGFLFASFALAFWVLLVPWVVPQIVPTSIWFELRSVFVEDATEGEPPLVVMDRVVRRDFTGDWAAYVRKVDGAEFALHCRRTTPDGPFRYRAGGVAVDPETGLPRDLRYWLEIPPNPDCTWSPGQYRLEWVQTIHLLAGIDVTVSRQSNVFTIREAPDEAL